ncbi:MAG: Translation initiation factor IF-2 [Candidatus Amesbacteria bacterium GW2011_GWA2_47_11b]|uniref:Translation initiation factor IF-2 n=4 Tax=Candidatus Amesiibacteriota TaxID=1752730 RepID=A0A0G1VEJ7_9BACT|nr:MAG: translation initiation factor IF-2, translation initiation factor IF-2 [Microgenomates group bacterium GW2011_GWC1_46_20]KKU57289.1 MAG: Translation initiation factor IF-2 [Candidatus Amesbacteria bacterium GW2011_GWA2_47_11b]KKU68445.1 MAG: Translation initiation factor IF-2 [Candidatus Amesbacteria bacterium GW2011_GWA1_47_20]
MISHNEMQTRPPIVVILGHVDHGKTSLLDALRKSDVATREVGGITQNITSFQLTTKDQQPVTFIDTPGHAAFSAMRARGGKIADLAILVVSAVDGVMPQTQESIATIKSAAIPTIVVITKMDLPGASAETVKSQLVENGVLVEGFGGDVPAVAVSAKTGAGLPELLEMIYLMSSLQPPTSDSSGSLECVVLESHLDTRRGPLATVIVKSGTLQIGQELYLDKLVGTAKALSVNPAPPSTPVEILGLTSVVPVGSVLSSAIQSQNPTSSLKRPPSTEPKVKLILKANVLGSLEAILASLPSEVEVVFSGTGDFNESDVLMAQSIDASLFGFGVKIPGSVVKLAETEKITIRNFNIIYELLDAVEKLVHPQETETVVGRAQILAEFKIDALRVAGCKCTEGEILKTNSIRIGDKLTRIKSLKIAKSEAEKVKSGQEFGVVFSPPVDFKIGDTIIAVTIHGTS